jgi:hypothetical protein
MESDRQIVTVKPPKSVVERRTPRVAIMDFADHTEARSRQLASLATDIFHNMVASMGRLRVVERAQARKLAQELGYQEEHGADWESVEQGYFTLGKDMDYVIVGSINRASPSVKQKPGYVDKNGNQIPPRCEAKVEVSVSARVIELAQGHSVRTFEMKGRDAHVKRAGCRVGIDMAKKALEKAINVMGPVEMAQAIPIYGYMRRLMSHMKSSNKKIAYINLGSRDGIKPGDQVLIMETQEDIDPISGKSTIRYMDIGKGAVVANGLSDGESIVLIEDPKAVNRAKVGCVVQTTAARAKAEARAQKTNDFFNQLFQDVGR